MVTRREGVRERWIDGNVSSDGHGHGHSHDDGHCPGCEIRAPQHSQACLLLFTVTRIVTKAVSVSVTVQAKP